MRRLKKWTKPFYSTTSTPNESVNIHVFTPPESSTGSLPQQDNIEDTTQSIQADIPCDLCHQCKGLLKSLRTIDLVVDLKSLSYPGSVALRSFLWGEVRPLQCAFCALLDASRLKPVMHKTLFLHAIHPGHIRSPGRRVRDRDKNHSAPIQKLSFPAYYVLLISPVDQVQRARELFGTQPGFKPIAMGNFPKKSTSAIPPPVAGRSLIDFSMLRDWITECKGSGSSSESESISRTRRTPPIHLINCTTREIVLGHYQWPYCALSYVWGTTPQPTTNTPILPTKCAKTIEDAITVCLGLGFQFLWVDAYCINQNDALAKHEQIFAMDLVYMRANLTIVASAGPDANHGLPGINSTPRHQTRMSVDIGGLRFDLLPPDPHRELERSIWRSRAWTYQENFFSAHVLIFSDHQVWFECRHTEVIRYESYNDPILDVKSTWWNEAEVKSSVLKRESEYSHYDFIYCLQEFTQCRMTFQTDSLNAALAMINAFADAKTSIATLWGIPWGMTYDKIFYQVFHRGLCWLHVAKCSRRKDFPSWSWAGWEGGVNWPENPCSAERDDEDYQFSYSLEAGTRVPLLYLGRDQEPPWNNQTPPRLIHLSGPCQTVTFTRRVTPGVEVVWYGLSGYRSHKGKEFALRLDHSPESCPNLVERLESEEKWICMFLGNYGMMKYCYLVVGKMNDTDEHYERIGLVIVDIDTLRKMREEQKHMSITLG